MKKILTITDLTRMKENRVCIFGIDEQGKGIRPNKYGTSEEYAIQNNILPFNEIEFDLTQISDTKPPHTEDWRINKQYTPMFIRTLSDEEKKEFLENILYPSVEDIFGAEIHENKYLNEGEGIRSLGTIKAKDILFVNYLARGEGKFNYRITFQDQSGAEYNLQVTDLAFRNHCDAWRKMDLSTGRVGLLIKEYFENTLIFLRVGLARPFPEMQNRCYLQVSGVYSFPDYLENVL